MEKNHFKEFDKIISDRAQMISEYASHYHDLKAQVEKKTVSVFYGRSAYHLGHFCPSLIVDKTTAGFKRDKLKKNIPKTKKGYVSYEVDTNDKLLRIKDINSFGHVDETYVIERDGEAYSITFSNGVPSSIIDSVRVLYEDEKVVRCDFISSHSMWSELYNYKDIHLNRIQCTQYYYVPGLKNSDKGNKAGELNSPMRQFDVKIHVDDLMNIKRMEYGELMNGKIVVTYIYEMAN
jgi:hypothetical protein